MLGATFYYLCSTDEEVKTRKICPRPNNQHMVWTQWLEPTFVCLTLDLGCPPPHCPDSRLEHYWVPSPISVSWMHFSVLPPAQPADQRHRVGECWVGLRAWHQLAALEIRLWCWLAVLSWAVYLTSGLQTLCVCNGILIRASQSYARITEVISVMA